MKVSVWRVQNVINIAKKFPNILCYGDDFYDYAHYSGKVNDNFVQLKLFESESGTVLKNIFNNNFIKTLLCNNWIHQNYFKLGFQSLTFDILTFKDQADQA